jgi:hypothetical protein
VPRITSPFTSSTVAVKEDESGGRGISEETWRSRHFPALTFVLRVDLSKAGRLGNLSIVALFRIYRAY